MRIIRRIFTVCALALFITYSIGICFSIHHCEHCKSDKIYLLNHPDCCEASTYEHHHTCSTYDMQSTHDCCFPYEQEGKDAKHHCHTNCCISNFKYFKIELLYDQPASFSLDHFFAYPFAVIESFSDMESLHLIVTAFNKAPPLKEIPPLKQGGSLFLIANHLQILYA